MLLDDDAHVFVKSGQKRKLKSKYHHINSSGKRKKVISSKLTNVSVGSFSKENLKGKNRVLALDLQKTKIELSKLNRKYVCLQQNNQDALFLVHKKRTEANIIQKHIASETKKRITNEMLKIDAMVNKSLMNLVINVTSSAINGISNKSTSDTRSSLKNRNIQEESPEKINVQGRIDRKICRSNLHMDQRLSRKPQKSETSDNLMYNEEFYMPHLSLITSKVRHPSIADIKHPTATSDIPEAFEEMPVSMDIPENQDCTTYLDVDMEMTEIFNSNHQTLDMANVPDNENTKVVLERTKFSDYQQQTFDITNNWDINNSNANSQKSKKLNENESLAIDSEILNNSNNANKRSTTYGKNFKLKPVKIKSTEQVSSKESKLQSAKKQFAGTDLSTPHVETAIINTCTSKPTKKILLTSRDREKTCNYREMFMPKVKSKPRKKDRSKVQEYNTPFPQNKSIFDFSLESPESLCVPDSYKAISDITEQLDSNVDQKTDSASKLRSGSNSRSLEQLQNEGKAKSSEDVSSQNTEPICRDTYSVPLKSDSPCKSSSDSSLARPSHSQSRGRPKSNGLLQNSEPNHVYSVPLQTNSPSKSYSDSSIVRRGRSRSRGRPNIVKSVELSEVYSVPIKTNSSTKSSEENLVKQGRSRSKKRPNTDSPEKSNINSSSEKDEIYSVPLKTDTPCKESCSTLVHQGRSRSRGRSESKKTDVNLAQNASEESNIYIVPLKMNSPKISDSNSLKRGHSQSRGRPKAEKRDKEQHLEQSDIYTVPLKTDSPGKSDSVSLQRGRSRSRGRPKIKSNTEVEMVTELYFGAMKTTSPCLSESSGYTSQSHSQSRSKYLSKNIAETYKSDSENISNRQSRSQCRKSEHLNKVVSAETVTTTTMSNSPNFLLDEMDFDSEPCQVLNIPVEWTRQCSDRGKRLETTNDSKKSDEILTEPMLHVCNSPISDIHEMDVDFEPCQVISVSPTLNSPFLINSTISLECSGSKAGTSQMLLDLDSESVPLKIKPSFNQTNNAPNEVKYNEEHPLSSVINKIINDRKLSEIKQSVDGE